MITPITPGEPHLGMEQLLALREPGREPGDATARAHIESCAHCSAELERLHQRAARLKALPTLRPARDQWPAVEQRLAAERARKLQRIRRAGLGGGLALAASIAVLLLAGNPFGTPEAQASTELSSEIERSEQLEQALETLDPESRVTDGLTAQMAGELEDRIAAVDQQLQMADLLEEAEREARLLELWRARVGLLDALVDVHLTQATNVGL